MPSLISVIVPAYNIEKYLPKTLDSILAQTYSNLEVIVVNDGSIDSTKNVINSFCQKDNRIKTIHKSNGGVTSARLEGMKHAKGDWIGFVDGDDFIDKDMFERLLQNAKKYDADISHCGYDMRLLSGRILSYYGTGKTVKQDKACGLFDLLNGKIIEPSLCNKLFSRTVIQGFLKHVTMDTSIRNNEDLLMNFYLFREAKCSVFEDFCPYHYIVRQGSAANAHLNEYQLLDPLKVRRILAKATRDWPKCHRLAETQVMNHLVDLATMDTKQNPGLQQLARKAARKELRQRCASVLLSSDYTNKTKLFCLWATIFPLSYRWIHSLYSTVKGTSNLYEK